MTSHFVGVFKFLSSFNCLPCFTMLALARMHCLFKEDDISQFFPWMTKNGKFRKSLGIFLPLQNNFFGIKLSPLLGNTLECILSDIKWIFFLPICFLMRISKSPPPLTHLSTNLPHSKREIVCIALISS